jgi:hypothetical protein
VPDRRMERVDAVPIAALDAGEAGVDVAELSVRAGAIVHMCSPIQYRPGLVLRECFCSNSLYCSRESLSISSQMAETTMPVARGLRPGSLAVVQQA